MSVCFHSLSIELACPTGSGFNNRSNCGTVRQKLVQSTTQTDAGIWDAQQAQSGRPAWFLSLVLNRRLIQDHGQRHCSCCVQVPTGEKRKSQWYTMHVSSCMFCLLEPEALRRWEHRRHFRCHASFRAILNVIFTDIRGCMSLRKGAYTGIPNSIQAL